MKMKPSSIAPLLLGHRFIALSTFLHMRGFLENGVRYEYSIGILKWTKEYWNILLSPNVNFPHLLYQKDFKRDYDRTSVPCYQTIAPSSSRYLIISILPLRHCTIEIPHHLTVVPSLHLHFTVAPSSSQHCSIDPYLDGPMVRWSDGAMVRWCDGAMVRWWNTRV